MTLKRKVWKQISYLPTLEYWPKLQKRKYTNLLTSQIPGARATAGQTRRVVLNTTRYFFTGLNTMLYYGHVLPVRLPEEMPLFGRLLCGIVCFFDSNDYQLIVTILANLKCRIIQQKRENWWESGQRPTFHLFLSFSLRFKDSPALSVHPNARIRISIRQAMW